MNAELDLFDNAELAGPSKLDHMILLLQELKRFRPIIEEALSHAYDSHSFDDIVDRVVAGNLDMYSLPNSVMLCETLEQPNFKQYHVYLGGGDLNEILAFTDQMVKEAKLRGCKYLSMTGRIGWGKVLKETGWKHSLSIYKKEL